MKIDEKWEEKELKLDTTETCFRIHENTLSGAPIPIQLINSDSVVAKNQIQGKCYPGFTLTPIAEGRFLLKVDESQKIDKDISCVCICMFWNPRE